MSEVLKPCPFCGGKAVLISDDQLKGWVYYACERRPLRYGHQCTGCAPSRITQAEAAEMWNARDDSATAELRRELEEVKRESDHYREIAFGQHSDPEKCPTYYDGCNCGGSTTERLEQVEAERDALKREVEELRRDKGRLDWLIATINTHGVHYVSAMQWTVIDDDGETVVTQFDRAAIDAASTSERNE